MNDNDNDGRKCWKTARERDRLKARFHIRERVAAAAAAASNDENKVDNSSNNPADITQLQQYITYIKSGDRSKFSLSQLDRHFHLVSSQIPKSLLLGKTTITTTALPGNFLSFQEHSLQLCQAWFGADYSRQLQSYLDSSLLATFTLMEYAVWMGKYSIVGALLLAGINPCIRGRHHYHSRHCRKTGEEIDYQENYDDTENYWSSLARMGSRVSKRFFDCFPLALSTYIVKRVVEMRRDVWVALQDDPSSCTNDDETWASQDPRNCDCCGRRRPTEYDDESLLFSSCQHSICEVCFWNDLLESIDRRGDLADVIVCPCCYNGKGSNGSSGGVESQFHNGDNPSISSSRASNSSEWDNLSPDEKNQKSLAKFQSLPKDRQALKSSGGKKKKQPPTERDHWASSWNEAVHLSLGSTQTVRRDRFFSFVEQRKNAFHQVRGCLYAGVDVQWTNEYGQSALYISAWRGYVEMARWVLEFGADPRTVAHDGWNPLEIATILGHEHIVAVMEEYGHCSEESNDSSTSAVAVVLQRRMPQDSSSSPPAGAAVLRTLIPRTTKHPGAGSFSIDQALSVEQIDWLLSLHARVPVETAQKKKAGLCSERSYFCDASGWIRIALQTAIQNALNPTTSSTTSSTTSTTVQVFAHMRFLDYSVVGTTLNPHVDICRVDPLSQRRSTHTFILYLTDCRLGGETSLLGDVSGDKRSEILACISPKRARLLLFPHACPHEGNRVHDVPKILLRGEVFLAV